MAGLGPVLSDTGRGGSDVLDSTGFSCCLIIEMPEDDGRGALATFAAELGAKALGMGLLPLALTDVAVLPARKASCRLCSLRRRSAKSRRQGGGERGLNRSRLDLSTVDKCWTGDKHLNRQQAKYVARKGLALLFGNNKKPSNQDDTSGHKLS
jgi:hypothetical protein